MDQEVIVQNRDMMQNLRISLSEVRRDFSSFRILWKYLRRKQKLQSILYAKVN